MCQGWRPECLAQFMLVLTENSNSRLVFANRSQIDVGAFS